MINFLIIILLIINIVLLIILMYKFFIKKSNNKDEILEIMKNEYNNLIEKMYSMDNNIQEKIFKNVDTMKTNIFENLMNIDSRMEKRLSDEFLKSSNIYKDITNQIVKIDETQKNILKLSSEVSKLQNILNDKKTRGIFGEIQLYHILENVFGNENKGVLYDTQYNIEGKIVDAVIYNENSKIPIDSKFPLENYLNVFEKDGKYITELKKNIKTHIDSICEKYIIKGITDQALMFIPAESIFLFIHSELQDIIEYSYKKKVWIVSPTTIMAILTSIEKIYINNMKYNNLDIIIKEIDKLSKEFERYKKRCDNIVKDVIKLKSDIDDLSITNNKIMNQFDNINKVKLD